MADVRLTATNPEDSSVVPVACDASGRLLLEEQGQGPPGPEGPPGPKGDDGDPFSGNFADDVTFGGSATFAGEVKALVLTTDPIGGGVMSYRSVGSKAHVWRSGVTEGNNTAEIFADGSAKFAGAVDIGPFTDGVSGVRITNAGTVYNVGQGENAAYWIGDDLSLDSNCVINYDGSISIAGNKAGFTAEGYLWCTTRRGDTVVLDATSNGLGSWVEYTPTSRIDDLRDRLDANRPDTGEMPADTQ